MCLCVDLMPSVRNGIVNSHENERKGFKFIACVSKPLAGDVDLAIYLSSHALFAGCARTALDNKQFRENCFLLNRTANSFSSNLSQLRVPFPLYAALVHTGSASLSCFSLCRRAVPSEAIQFVLHK